MSRAAVHLPYLDGWRGLAIACLLLGHFFAVPGINFGTVGVHLFFVLSGLLMTRILFVQKPPLRLFYQRRIARIFPSVYVYLLVVSLLFLLGGRELSMLELLTAATFTNNYILPAGNWTMPFGHIWSLSVEEHAYVLLSLVAVATRSSARRSLLGVGLVVGTIVLLAGAYGVAGVPKVTWHHSEVAAYGIFASSLVFLWRGRHGGLSAHPLAVPLLMLIGLAAHWWSAPAPLRLLVGCGAFALALNSLERAPARLHALLSWAPLRRLGVWSFSLYLWQQPFYQLVRHEGMHPALGLALGLVVGVAAFYAIEQPARDYLNRRWAPAPAPLGDAQKTAATVAVEQPAQTQRQTQRQAQRRVG